MEDFESLISADELKWGYLLEAAKKPYGYKMRYDDQADMVMIIFTSPEQETVVFYVDNHVGLLVNPDTMDVVGFQIEAFRHSFLQNHDAVDRVWRMSDANIHSEDFPDFTLHFKDEKTERSVIREIIRATEAVVDEPAVEDVVAALA